MTEAEKRSFEDKGVPKCNLGTREKQRLTPFSCLSGLRGNFLRESFTVMRGPDGAGPSKQVDSKIGFSAILFQECIHPGIVLFIISQSFEQTGKRQAELILRRVDSVRSREPSPFGIACGDSVLLVPNGQDQDDGVFSG